jgi:hypothetical protein
MIWNALKVLLPPVFNIIDKAVPDRDQAEKLKHEIQSGLLTYQSKELEAATSVIIAEAKGDSWLQRNWRPVTMLTFAGLVVAHWLGWTAENLTEAEILALLNIVKVGLGGYVVGRSVEKAVKEYKKS